jgi:hypothetical protein
VTERMSNVKILEIFDTLAREDAPHNGLMRLTRRVMQTECLANSQSTVHKLFERWKDVCLHFGRQLNWILVFTHNSEILNKRLFYEKRAQILDKIECENIFIFSNETICADWFNILLCERMMIKMLHALIFEKYPSAKSQAIKYEHFCYNLSRQHLLHICLKPSI